MHSVVVAVVRSVLTTETAKKLAHVWIVALAAASAGIVARRLHGEKPRRDYPIQRPRRLP